MSEIPSAEGIGTAIEYCAVVPLCPTENHLHYSGNLRRYATKDYRNWLKVAGPILRGALPDEWTADTENWWSVSLELYLGPVHGDATNYVKAVLDALSGSQPNGDGKIEKPGLLWDDDKRVRQCTVRIVERRCEDPRIGIFAHPTFAPSDAREAAKAAAKAAKERAADEHVYACRRWVYDSVFVNYCNTDFHCRNGRLHGFTAAAVKGALTQFAAEGVIVREKTGWRVLKGIVWR